MAKKKAKRKTSKKKTGPKPRTKGEIIATLTEELELPRKTVVQFFDTLTEMIATDLNPKSRTAPGKFTIPGLVRLATKKRPARKARKGVNPFTGEEMMFKAKPATNVVKAYPVKALKDTVA